MNTQTSTPIFPKVFTRFRLRILFFMALGGLFFPPAVFAANILWTGGAGDGMFETGGNWQGGTVPASSDWQDVAIFGSSATPETVTLAASRSIKTLDFETAGWTLNGADFSNLKYLKSDGSGTNTISGGFTVANGSNPDWTVGMGNVLSVGSIYQNGCHVTLTGGGTLVIGQDVTGWGTPEFQIEEATLRVLDNRVHQVSGGVTYLNQPGSRVELQTDVSTAQALIGGAVVDGVGNGLEVNAIGGGFVEIVPVAGGDPLPPIDGDWTLEFEDNFDGTTLDHTKWKVGTHHDGIAGAGGNAPELISVGGGVLNITASTANTTYSGSGYNYSTGEISTFQLFRQKYGYYEARMKYPAVTGLWPAFWLMPDRAQYGWTGNYYRSYIKFDLTGVNPGSISSAQLKLKTTYRQSGGAPHVLVFGSEDDSWSESTLTWNNKTGYDPAFLDQIYNNFTVGNDSVFEVGEYVSAQMSGDKILTFVLADTFMRDREIRYGSREDSVQNNRPRLVIDGVTYYASEDANVRWSEANTNFGSASTLRVKDGWGDTSTTYNGGMEVDIMESLGIWGADRTQNGLHWDGYGNDWTHVNSGKLSYSSTPDGFHTYGLYWEEDRFEFYIDGMLSWQWEGSRAMSTAAYLILSLQLGGWDNNNPGSQVEGQSLEVDYVRVWSGSKTPATGTDGGRVLFSQSEQSSYSDQDAGSGTVSGNGSEVALSGNTWKKYPYDYTVTSSTILRFGVNASDVGEILAIGFDNNNNHNDGQTTIQIAGTQNWAGAYQLDAADKYVAGSGTVYYEIAVGEWFTGAMTSLVLIGDDDANGSTSATFSDIEVFEAQNFDSANMTNYSNQNAGSASVSTDGKAVSLSGNAWKKFPFTYTVTSNTVLRFTVNASDVGEILAIGLDNDNDHDNDKRVVQIAGSQDWSAKAFQVSGAEVYQAGSGEVSYSIPLGSLLTGSMSYLCLVGDDDANGSTSATFSNISLSEN